MFISYLKNNSKRVYALFLLFKGGGFINKFKYCLIVLFFICFSSKKSFADINVMIDPGHGGHDSGAISYDGKYKEKDLNLDTALSIKDELEKHGVKVYMTREEDTYMPLEDRSTMANNIKDLDVLVSVHHNAASNNETYRTEVIYQAKNEKESQRLAELISNKLALINDEIKIYTRYNKQGFDYYSILRNTNTVANIVEVSFISSQKGYELVDTYDERVRNGKLVAEGIMDYLGVNYSENEEVKENKTIVAKKETFLDKLLNILNNKKDNNKGLSILYKAISRGE